MKTLLILRHAKSSWQDADLTDHDRPLKKKGKRAARRIGQLLIEESLVPQLILSSSAKRAHKTAKVVAKACQYEGEIRKLRRLYQAGPTGHIQVLRDVSDDYQRVMIVGHNPGLEVLLEVLTGEASWLPTAALAHVELPIETWEQTREYVNGQLVSLWEPKRLSKPSG